MKTLAFLATLFTSLNAQAQMPAYHQSVILPNVQINGADTRYTAVTTIDVALKQIEVVIYDDICSSLTAPKSVVTCLAMPRQVESFKAEILSRETPCNSVHYHAMTDKSPVDGLRVTIDTYDHSTRICEDVIASPFEVKAEVFNPWAQKTAQYYLSK